MLKLYLKSENKVALIEGIRNKFREAKKEELRDMK